ncbi:MAG TPA: DUF1003 domain-containing protein [Propioniciclava sp.]|uniref:DUF1003 domain-containing protein n=1 Tax=Propioniciclava sp. TaxID=2038686 RepID=UPI002BA0BE93|nr:DUF1003 domain-containing protein [Propioniciclava sp.]HRL48506.1 DUF1003 domain-containing protein [Propioniciclava sp.]HRL78988.1 DUF1003 domain-containing protein [Propioniciclava sp.]
MAAGDRLNTPGRNRSWLPRMRLPDDAFGSFAETFARFMGTAQFILWMTVFIIAWIVVNRFNSDILGDPFPFIFLTLLLSLQASYSAPLILLAQNRSEARERVSMEHDRQVASQSRADMDFLAREIAALRIRINDMPTRDFLRSELRDLVEELEREDEERDANPPEESHDEPASSQVGPATDDIESGPRGS